MILSCGAPILGLLFDGVAYIVAKNDTNLNQLPPFMITIIITIIFLPAIIYSFQFVELYDNKIVNYLLHMKTFEIELSDIKQWGHYNSIGGRYAVVSYPFIYISNKNFDILQFDFSKIKSKKYKFIKIFPYDDRLEKWLQQNAHEKFL
jgi:hypothetical protein